MTTVLGIDEAGRGSVIGPLVIAGLMIDAKDEIKLKQLGVKDSKLLSEKQRNKLYDEIKKIAKDYVVLKIGANEIDQLRLKTNLNKIEGQKMAEIIKTLSPDKAILDAPQVSTDKFRDFVKGIAKNKTKIISENYADFNHPVVAGASILAKVERDREIEKIKRLVEFDFGVGYPHDSRSIEFVKNCIKNKTNLQHIRHSWVTVLDAIIENEQKKLKDFK